jgi:protein involved in polysaccharide export with SLBB domain
MLTRRTVLLIALSFAGVASLAQQPPYYSEMFTIKGKVWRPGKYFVQDSKRVYDAIQNAGGLKDDADRKVSIHRADKEYVFDYGAYLRGEKIEDNIALKNGDIIEAKAASAPPSVAK